jgi:hypothetical protein
LAHERKKTRKKLAPGKAASLQQPDLVAQVLVELLMLMASVETQSAEAKLNENSMDDNNGGRIWF